MQQRRPSPGCWSALAVAVGVPALLLGGWLWQRQVAHQAALEAQEKRAEEVFEPALRQLSPKAEPVVDLDKTVRVLHGLDQALANQDNLENYLLELARQDYRNVDPKVLEARKDLMAVLQDLYATQTELEDQQALWEVTSELFLSTLSVVSVEGNASLTSPSGKLAVDRAQAQALLSDVQQRREIRRELEHDLLLHQNELFDALVNYSQVYWDTLQRWDELSLMRDRAWLAVANGDWDAAEASATLAVERAPLDREAHLILAMAKIENGGLEDGPAVEALLDDYLKQHADSTAPALLLSGVHLLRQGQPKEARLAFQQSAAYYPRQADQLTDMFDPYEQRAFLQRTREGGTILEGYRSMMLGAGYFSPDLQLARALFEAGDDDAGRVKVLDHFARRRSQQQWDFILSDVQFCHDTLGPHFWKIFPEDTWLDLEVSPTMFGSGLNLAVRNRSSKTLHNATLVLALHLTDMVPGAYVALAAPQTAPAVLQNEVTSFGSLDIALEHDGKPKTVADIVHHRAILVSNEAVTWVDTDAYRTSEAQAFRDRQRTSKAATGQQAPTAADRYPGFQDTISRLVGLTEQDATLSVASHYGNDDVVIELPRELALLKPLFRLRLGDTLFDATDNVIDGDHIALRFAGVENFDNKAPERLELVVGSPFGEVVLSWLPGDDLRWRLQ